MATHRPIRIGISQLMPAAAHPLLATGENLTLTDTFASEVEKGYRISRIGAWTAWGVLPHTGCCAGRPVALPPLWNARHIDLERPGGTPERLTSFNGDSH